MRIRWTPAAAADLQHISDYLQQQHPRYRDATVRRLYKTLRTLKDWPDRGRIGRAKGTKELLFPPLPYVAVSRVTDQSLEILRIYHTAQDRPKEEDGI